MGNSRIQYFHRGVRFRCGSVINPGYYLLVTVWLAKQASYLFFFIVVLALTKVAWKTPNASHSSSPMRTQSSCNGARFPIWASMWVSSCSQIVDGNVIQRRHFCDCTALNCAEEYTMEVVLRSVYSWQSVMTTTFDVITLAPPSGGVSTLHPGYYRIFKKIILQE